MTAMMVNPLALTVASIRKGAHSTFADQLELLSRAAQAKVRANLDDLGAGIAVSDREIIIIDEKGDSLKDDEDQG